MGICGVAVSLIVFFCGVAVILNGTVCGVSGLKPRYGIRVKRNNLRTLCGVQVYHLAVVTTKNQAKQTKRT